MLYLHCGWPRTSTTSLQAALYEHRDLLAAGGFAYPDQWSRRTSFHLAHHGLYELIDGSPESKARHGEFEEFLDTHADRDVLFSAEAITHWLESSEREEAFLELLAMAQDVTPTKCVWTLRRFDELLESLYLLRLRRRVDVISPDDFFDQLRFQGYLFGAMRAVEDVLGADNVTYVKYEAAGHHNDVLLQAFGVPEQARKTISEQLRGVPRLHVSLNHKEASAFACGEDLSARAGVGLDGGRLRAAFKDDGFKFEQDRPCELLEENVKTDLHEWALTASREDGITSYSEFFRSAEIDAPTSAGLTAEAITDSDLESLLAHLRNQPSSG